MTYGEMWGIKCQGIFLPNDMLANIISTLVAQNDKGVINISGFEERTTALFEVVLYCSSYISSPLCQ